MEAKESYQEFVESFKERKIVESAELQTIEEIEQFLNWAKSQGYKKVVNRFILRMEKGITEEELIQMAEEQHKSRLQYIRGKFAKKEVHED